MSFASEYRRCPSVMRRQDATTACVSGQEIRASQPDYLQLAEQAVRSRIKLRDHVFERRLLRLRQRKLRGHLSHVGLHQVGLRGGQLRLLALVTASEAAVDLGNRVIDGHALLRNIVQRGAQCRRVAHRLRGVNRAAGVIGHQSC